MATAASNGSASGGSRTRIGRENTAIVILFVLPVIAIGLHLWLTRTPNPRIKTAVVINRNSLLPHRFAGPCVNCHRIQEVGPVAMNRNNMQLFSLSPRDQSLLLAGQRVDVPTIAQRIRMPAILRSDILPHPFVGVCSNCHIEIDIRPSPAFMRRAMDRAYTPLEALDLSPEQIARAGAREHHKGELLRNIFGFVALGLFLSMCVYIVMRTLIRSNPSLWKGKFNLKKWFVVHEWSATAFCLAAVLHWYYSDRGNNLLHIALLVVIWLTLAGFALRHRLTHDEVRKDVRLLHSQRVLFFGLIALLVIGHFFAGFE